MKNMTEADYEKTLIEQFLAEDVDGGDITTDSIIDKQDKSEAVIVAKEDGVIAGHRLARGVFCALDPDIIYDERKSDGSFVRTGDTVVRISGKTRAILSGERTALNILQRLSGAATITRRFVDQIAGTKAKILDTRKTTPGMRVLEKYAVRMGGGDNHRINLNDMALIKENHITAAGSIQKAVQRVRKAFPDRPVEVEVRNMEELEQALGEPVDRIMLDNWSTEDMKKGVARVNGRVELEASGNMSLERVREVAETGVDLISVGSITHSYKSLDLSLLIV
ncbi:MAG TPA: carboxylating nicotinate-nucleotide diphosphorylase [Deltaproteobacteria bacterium]|nr:carboxylating nicotinate-nucleotide diphosphorylase [Deltaproteobacteria bacterium]